MNSLQAKFPRYSAKGSRFEFTGNLYLQATALMPMPPKVMCNGKHLQQKKFV